MRSPWIVAATAVFCCAAPAEAARYLEFTLTGSTITPFSYSSGTGFTAQVLSTVTIRIDTQNGNFLSDSSGIVAEYRPGGVLRTVRTGGRTEFELSFDPTQIVEGADLQPLSAAGSFGYTSCYRYGCLTQRVGTLTSFTARTTDVPLTPGLIDTITVLPVPEPASWALMIGGFGTVGAAVRRRRARPGVAFT